MGFLGRPQPVQLVMGVIYGDEGFLEEAATGLAGELGEIDLRSEAFEFDVTDYYQDEMGPGLKRVFLSFKNLIDPGDIVDIKLMAAGLEQEMSREGKRTVNLDPGYMDFNKLVLVSAKFLAQKIYLAKGVYADPTIYYDKGWRDYEWAFPDFRSGRYGGFFSEVRNLYKAKMRNMENPAPGGSDREPASGEED
ncbi:MAG: DUF4416 family protein [bacterium]|jgi:hypothetical protein